jgi:TRAP-type mannitol/chloroaromatic compound transport system permease small subunit
MEDNDSFLSSQETATGLFPEPHESSLQPENTLLFRYILIVPFHLIRGLPTYLYFSIDPTKAWCEFLDTPIHAAGLVRLNVTTLIILSRVLVAIDGVWFG